MLSYIKKREVMGIILEILLLLAGFGLLIKGADIFVGASSDIAKRLKIPNLIIGLTIVAMGTSLPEAVVSISAAVNGSSGIAVGNVIGSSIANLLFIIGFCALVNPIRVKLEEIARDFWISVGAAALLLLMMVIFRESIPRLGAFVLFVGFTIYMIILIRLALKNKEQTSEFQENQDGKNGSGESKPVVRIIFFAVLGAALILAGGQFTVRSAVNIALALGITERVVGLTIVALGTSLPEFVTTFVAYRKGKGDMAIGNIIGSNIFNILFILGMAGMITPLAIDGSLIFDAAVLTAGSLAFLLFATSGKRIVRFEGLSMVAIYAAYMIFVIL